MKKYIVIILRIFVFLAISFCFLKFKLSLFEFDYFLPLVIFLSLSLVADLFIKRFTNDDSQEALDNYRKLGIIFLLNSILLFELMFIITTSLTSINFLLFIPLLVSLIPVYYSIKRKMKVKYHLIFYFIGLLLISLAIINYYQNYVFGGSKAMADDARIRSAVNQLRSSAEIYKLRNSYYSDNIITNKDNCSSVVGSFFDANSDAISLCEDLQKQGQGTLTINITKDKYCIQKKLHTKELWCLDSAGFEGCVTGAGSCSTGAAHKGCDAVNYNCL